MLAYLQASSDVLDGWLYWAAGPGWGDSYPFTLEPTASGADRPQMRLLTPYLTR
jgi:endoglucanase